jgi:membrane protein DedA with SNARE-associated domain
VTLAVGAGALAGCVIGFALGWRAGNRRADHP